MGPADGVLTNRPARPARPSAWHALVERASLPAFVLLATFLAIEVAAVMRRPGRLWVLAGVAMGALTFGTGGMLAIAVWNVVGLVL
jgi:lipopolysaccharide export LptBFGC system permease protein LptF